MPNTILEILRDPAWQFIGATIALLSILVAWWIYWLQKQTRELAFGLASSRRPLAIADELSSRVTVQLDGKSVKNLHLLVFGFKNSGNRAISPADFERKLSISFLNGQVVSADISSQSPPNLGGELLSFESRIELSPLLLNSGDYMLIQVLLSAEKPKWEVDVRVRDVAQLVPINTDPPILKSGVPMLIIMTSSIGLLFLFFGKAADKSLGYFIVGISIFIMPIIVKIIKIPTPARRSVYEA